MAGFAVEAVVLRQKGRELYCFGMNSAVLKRISYVAPRGDESPEEVQRMLSQRRAKEIGQYIRTENALLPGSIVVSLTDDVSIQPTGRPDVRVVNFPDDEGYFAYIIDGQHRLAGFDHSGGLALDLPVVAINDADINLRGKIFADINSKQERVSDVHLLSLYYQIRDLAQDETSVVDVVIRLNNDSDSPLQGKIKMMTHERGKWTKNTAMKKWLAPHLNPGGVLASKTVAEQAVIIKEYFKAVQRTWPGAWADTRHFSLSRPIGLEIVLGLFAPVKHRCDLNAGRQYTADTFESQMTVLRGVDLEIPGGTLSLDWQRGRMGLISNRAARTLLIRELTDILHRADEPDPAE